MAISGNVDVEKGGEFSREGRSSSMKLEASRYPLLNVRKHEATHSGPVLPQMEWCQALRSWDLDSLELSLTTFTAGWPCAVTQCLPSLHLLDGGNVVPH